MWDTMKKASERLNFKPVTPYKAHHVDMIKRWVQMGLGWSLIPKRTLRKIDTQNIETKQPEKKTYIKYVGVMLKGSRSEKIMLELKVLR